MACSGLGLFLRGSSLIIYQKRNLFLPNTSLKTAAKTLVSIKTASCLRSKYSDEGLRPYESEFEVHRIRHKWFKYPGLFTASLCRVCIAIYRLTKLIIIFTPVLVLYPCSFISPRLHSLWWQYFLFSVQISGPVFVKLCQWASTRRDIFSPTACTHLSSFQRDTTPHSWMSTCDIMEKTFGPSWQELFSDFDTVPVGSGCVAQVYQAYLKQECTNKGQKYNDVPLWKFWTNPGNGADSCKDVPVAVKVLHPYVRKELEQNIGILQFCAGVAECIVPSLKWLSLTDCVTEFEKFMMSQIDLAHEAKMLDVFHENFKTVENVNFPKPIQPYVSREVLIETWEEGIPISQFLGDSHPHVVKKKLAEIGVDVLLKMVFDDNFVHSDLHPGNILVQNCESVHFSHNEKVKKTSGSSNFNIFHTASQNISIAFVILDCGLVSSLPDADFPKFVKVFQAVALGQGEVAGELFLKHSVNECQNPEKFKTEMNDVVLTARKDTLTLGKVDVGKLLGSVFSLLTTHKIKLESNFASLMLAIMVLEGLGRSLDPTMDIIEKAKPYLFSHVFPF